VLLGAGLAGLQIASSVPNLYDAVKQDGAWYQNLAQTTSGRAGVLQLAGGTIGATVFTMAMRRTPKVEGGTVIQRVVAAGRSPLMAKPIWGRIGLASTAVVMTNELGYLDFLNQGETRSTPKVLRDATHKTPVLNDSSMRTAALLGAGGIFGFKAHRVIQAAGGIAEGGLAHVGRGTAIGGAVTAGLLGVQLLGGLSALDKPAGD
jgi:hypothetical protein